MLCIMLFLVYSSAGFTRPQYNNNSSGQHAIIVREFVADLAVSPVRLLENGFDLLRPCYQ
jgi:hypothetical protein